MPAYRPILLTPLAVGALCALTACGGSSPTTNTTPATSPATSQTTSPVISQTTSPVTSTSAPTNTAGPPSRSPATSTTTSPHGNTAIPQLAGDTVSVAELYLQQAGLRAGQTLQRSNTEYQSGLVITTSPYTGDIVPSGYTVDLLVSDGSPGCQGPSCAYLLQFVTMPYVIGQTLPQVTTVLALDSITLGTAAVEASSEPAGTVICTDPAPGVTFVDTGKVNVGVSSGDPGSPPATVCIPPTGSPTSSTASPPTSPTGPLPTSPVQPSVSP